MRPSNQFAEITEDQFSKKEADKNAYKRELQQQIEQAQKKRADAKLKRIQDELNEERLFLQQIGQESQSHEVKGEQSESVTRELDYASQYPQQPLKPAPTIHHY